MVNLDLMMDYIESKGATLFGRAFDTSQPDSRREAAEWLAGEFEGFDSWIDKWALREDVPRDGGELYG